MLLNASRRLVALLVIVLANAFAPYALAETSAIPPWLKKHVGWSEGKIAPVVLQRARALYQRKVREGVVSNACYMAMDATRPNTWNGRPGRRFYTICESLKSFRAISSGHGNGRKLRQAKFRNGRECAKHFSNTEGSNLTAGGSYVTAEIRQSFKGYYRGSDGDRPFVRPFLIFDGEGDTSNSRERDIGGHEAVFLRAKCRYLHPSSPYADEDGYVPFGSLVNYTGGRSNGCTTWSPSDSDKIISIVEGNPTTLYLYPESGDINAVASAVSNGVSPSSVGLYWDESCLDAIGSPRFWPKDYLQPIVNEWRLSLPIRPARLLPICE